VIIRCPVRASKCGGEHGYLLDFFLSHEALTLIGESLLSLKLILRRAALRIYAQEVWRWRWSACTLVCWHWLLYVAGRKIGAISNLEHGAK
jgi:hypothetical protein